MNAAIVIPAGIPAEAIEKIRAANPGLFLVVAQGEVPAEQPKANRHTWLTVISVLKGLVAAGKTAGIFTGPLIPIAASVLGLGLDRAEQAISGAPEVEDWTIHRIAAERAAVQDPQT